MIKKKLLIAILLVGFIFCIFGCKRKPAKQNTNVVTTTETETTIDEEAITESESEEGEMSMSFGEGADQEQVAVSENTGSDFEQDLESSGDGEYVDAEEEIDFSVFNDLNFEESSSIFTVTSLENKLDDVEGVLVVYTTATGALSGMPGTYTLQVPFTLNWKRGDRAHVTYKTCFYEDEEAGESLIVSDLVFIEKTDDKAVSRAQQIAEEREEQKRRDAEIAAQQAAIEESKKQAEAEVARQKEEVARQKRQAQITFEQQQAAIVESIKAKEAAAAAGLGY